VTPFVISLPSGKPATHVDRRLDLCDPAYVPAVGEWIFVDLTPERARERARQGAECYWTDPEPRVTAEQQFGSIERLARMLAKRAMEHPGAPDLVQVTEEIRERFLAGHGQAENPEAEARAAAAGEASCASGHPAGAAVPQHGHHEGTPPAPAGRPHAAPADQSGIGSSPRPGPGAPFRPEGEGGEDNVRGERVTPAVAGQVPGKPTAGEPSARDWWTYARERLAGLAPDASIILGEAAGGLQATLDQAGIPVTGDTLLAWLAGAAWYAGAFDPEPVAVRTRRLERAEEVACVLRDRQAGGGR
jgi:hypothetical protein